MFLEGKQKRQSSGKNKKKKSVYRGGGVKKYVGVLGAEEDCGKAKGES